MRNPFAEDPHESWRRWGERDPYYAVLLDRRHRRGRLDAAGLAALYASGETYVARLEARFDSLAAERRRGTVLDFGCGVGRLTLPLARRYRAAIGVDIAPGMLREAERQAAGQAIANARFAERLPDQPVDAIYAFSVLQHMDQAECEATLRAFARLLRPGGVGMVHVLIGDRRSRLHRLYGHAVGQVPLLRLPVNLLRGRPLADPPIRMNRHSLTRLTALLKDAGLRVHIGEALGNVTRHVGVEILFHRPA
jgi:trans-aconitate methyltransferase